ncbi:von Willebrand factor type A domain-containing protein [Pseudomonas pohangensis]|uniref:von Willebrand factor type A domain-containing protein n=1 Tax=Pseudomonas pohangensis TaxID=364197 RepID=A0A1H2DV31_9PSED|nr:VWA domain-containing protein [Pseudomonas pohangensis]SDT86689.1 von Willebrand factor type A domain-containing protein [Pseudomonas pohangensis]
MGLAPRQEIATYACQKDPKALPPEFVVVLDTSGSMGFNADISREDEDWLMRVGQKLPANNPRVKRLFSGLARIDIAKQSFANMIRNLHPKIDIRFITFGDCNAQVDHGIFDLAQRPALVSGINGLKAYGGTPLASSLEQAANQVDGRDRDAVIVMFIDGEEGCNRDVCEVSKRISREQPRLRVNVVNISKNSNPKCISENTGGRIYTAESSEQISSMLREATEEVSSSAACSGEKPEP